MMYITAEDLRRYLGAEATTQDDLLQEAISDAQTYIESQTNRWFEARTATRYFERAKRDEHNSAILHLDADLLTVTTLTNGDSDGTEITSDYYWLLDRNEGPPYHQIQLTSGDGYYWQWDEDCWVSVLGTWGYSATPPADIRRACTALAAYFYRQKDAQTFDTTAVVESGALVIPQGIPATVDRILLRYRKMI